MNSLDSIAIQTSQLSRQYKSYKKNKGLTASLKGFFKRDVQIKNALMATDLQIESGSIVGLVGSNGAGKTTLLKLLAGLIFPTAGTAKVLGFTPWERKSAYLKQMSILLGQKAQLWWDLPAVDSFDLLARIYELDPKKTQKRFYYLAERLECLGQLNTQLRRLSLGERMKMEIIGSLLHHPKILFLDEPTIGLDVVAQKSIRDFIVDLKKEEAPTIILTSHYMDDIARLAERLMLISHGSIVYDGTVDKFVQQSHPKNKVWIKLVSPLPQDLNLFPGKEFKKGEKLLSLEVETVMIGELLQEISRLSGIEDINIEKMDFEDVIRTFMEKDHRTHSTVYPVSS